MDTSDLFVLFHIFEKANLLEIFQSCPSPSSDGEQSAGCSEEGAVIAAGADT